MIGDWLAHSGLFALALLVLFLPGLLIGTAARLHGLALVAVAPAISVGMLALLAILFPFVGLTWSHASVAVAVLLLTIVVWCAARLIGRPRSAELRRTASRGSVALVAAGLVVGGGLNAARLMTYVGLPTAISQTNDAVFHLNALRWIAETGSASSLDLTGMVGSSSFYPSAWHAVASLVALQLGQIPVAANMVALAIAAVVWPLGVAYLTQVVSGGRTATTALAAGLSAGLLAFPQLMVEWGILYPYALSVALLPAAVAISVTTLRGWAGTRGLDRWRVCAGPALAAALGAVSIGLAQPSSILVLLLLVLLWCSSRVRRSGRRARVVGIGVLLAGWMSLVLAWLALAHLAGPVLWKPYRSPLGAVADVVLNSHSQLPAAWGMSALLLVGLVLAVRGARWRWFALAWVIISFLYVISISTDLPIIKRALTGPWYGDSFRIAAIVPLVVVPLAALGFAAVLHWAAKMLPVLQARWTAPAALAVVAAIGSVSVIVAPVVLLRVAAETDHQSRYALDEDSYLSEDELALLTRLPDLVPEDALLIGNPSTGSGFTYLLGLRDMLPRTWSPPQSEAWSALASGLRNAGADPEVCAALAAYGQPEYVLDFGPGGTGPGEYVMPGMTDFENRTGFEMVAREGDASLWRITACG